MRVECHGFIWKMKVFRTGWVAVRDFCSGKSLRNAPRALPRLRLTAQARIDNLTVFYVFSLGFPKRSVEGTTFDEALLLQGEQTVKLIIRTAHKDVSRKLVLYRFENLSHPRI